MTKRDAFRVLLRFFIIIKVVAHHVHVATLIFQRIVNQEPVFFFFFQILSRRVIVRSSEFRS